jgi:diacylglycerol kinase
MMKNFLYGFLYAMTGIATAIREQRNLKVQLAIAVAVIVAGVYFQVTAPEWCILLLTIALVIGMEMMNSAIEDLVNLVTREHHPLAGKVKDIAAGAVLVMAIVAVVVGGIVFWKYL